jgi:XTP/dITP diphosphohydrolase
MALIFATANPHKIREVNALLDDSLEILGLEDIGCREDIPETQPTIQGNAIQKAQYVHDNYQVDCFAEDTGLEIDALNGEPGVYTARFAGPTKDPEANMALALKRLEGVEDRGAQFRTVVALILDGELHTFEGIARGTIREAKAGDGGFGYDPIFQPDGYDQTFAELPQSVKNQISHRGKAVKQLIDFLRRRQGSH